MEHIDMVLFQQERLDVLEDFMDSYHSASMQYLASDLLQQGLTPRDIVQAIRRAVAICQNGGEDPRKHFFPIYTQYEGNIMKDCKLSRLGYHLTLLNAPEHLLAVARFQLTLLQQEGS